MKRISAIIISMLLLPAILLSGWLIMTESGLRWSYQQLAPLVDAQITLDSLEGRLIGPVTIRGLAYQQDGILINIDRAEVNWSPGALLAASLEIKHIAVQTVSITLPPSTDSNKPLSLPTIILPWHLVLDDVFIRDLHVSQNGKNYALQQLKLSASSNISQIDIVQFHVAADNFNLSVNGKIQTTDNYPHELNLVWQYHLPASEIIKGNGKLSGNLNLTHLQQKLAGKLPLIIDAELKDLLVEPSWNARVKSQDMVIHSRGEWLATDEGGNIAVALDWQNLRWPLNETPRFSSPGGSGWITGNLNHYHLGLASSNPWPQFDANWYASAEGNLEAINFHSLRVDALNGETNAKGQLSWTPQLTWQAQVNASNINPAVLWPQWPGQLHARISTSGQFTDNQLSATADISNMRGTLRDYPVKLSSHMDWRNNGLDVSYLEFTSGGSQLSAQGRIADAVTMEWSIKATDLAELVPGAGGQLQLTGSVVGPRNTPSIRTSFNGQSLSLNSSNRVETVSGSLALQWPQWQQAEIDLDAQTIMVNDYALQSLLISNHNGHMAATMTADAFTAQLAITGKTTAQGWRGKIEQADISSKQFTDWRLNKVVAIDVDSGDITLEPLCWHNNTSNICISAQKNNINWQANVNGSQIPLQLLGPWLPADLQLEGHADARARIDYQPAAISGSADITLSAGAASYPLLEGERDHWQYQGGAISITLTDQGLSAQARLAISNNDHFNGRVVLPRANLLSIDLQHQELQAEAQLITHNPGLIGALIPEAQNLQGKVEFNLAASGTLAQPRLSGKINLRDGAVNIPRLDLVIDRINLQCQTEAMAKLNFRLTARSGEGTLNISGQTALDRDAGWPTKMSIKGEAFAVAHIPEARVLVSPDLQVSLKQKNIHIEGKIHIPSARLQPKDITTAVQVSEDSVIIGEDQGAEEKWLISTRVRITLGDRIHFYGFGFEGRFSGALLLHDEPGYLTTATGELSVPEGRYRAYGQRLDVEHGRLLYTGGPLGNPGLDFRAVRHIGEVTAGLKVRGSLKQPQIELFSIPATGQTDAMAYLLLGHTIENTSGEEGAMMAKAALALGLSGGDKLARTLGDRFGLDEMRVESSDSGEQASLVIGRYLSSKLYVSYGVGLIEAFNTFSVRYRLSDKWQLKGESGEYQGADLLYTIER